MPVDPYEAPESETPAQKRERLMHLTDENWTPGSDPLMPPEPVEPEPVPPEPAAQAEAPEFDQRPEPAPAVAKSEPAPAPAPARAVRGSGDAAQRKS